MQVIPFPTQKVRQKRLSRTLANLENSFKVQQEAVERFRNTNLELHKEVKELGVNLRKFGRSLGQINVRPLRKNSFRLMSMMAAYGKA